MTVIAAVAVEGAVAIDAAEPRRAVGVGEAHADPVGAGAAVRAVRIPGAAQAVLAAGDAPPVHAAARRAARVVRAAVDVGLSFTLAFSGVRIGARPREADEALILAVRVVQADANLGHPAAVGHEASQQQGHWSGKS